MSWNGQLGINLTLNNVDVHALVFGQFYTLCQEFFLLLGWDPYEAYKQTVSLFEHVECVVNDLVFSQELLVNHHERDIIVIFQRIVHIQVVDELTARLRNERLDGCLLLSSLVKIINNLLERCLIEVGVETTANAHNSPTEVGGVIKDNHIALHGVKCE